MNEQWRTVGYLKEHLAVDQPNSCRRVMKGPNELWQPKNAVYFLNEFQFQFFLCQLGCVFLQFFWLLLFVFFNNVFKKEVLASLFSCGTYFVGGAKRKISKKTIRRRKKRKKIMRCR